MRMCEDLGQATGVENQHDDTKDQHKSIDFNCRSVFVNATSTILEGERDYIEQTLATPTRQRLCFLRGVVKMF